LFRMTGPKGMFLAVPIGLPCSSNVFLNETLHDQGWVEYDKRHSVGHLPAESEARSGNSKSDLPGACSARTRESDPRDRFDQGGLSSALRAHDGNHGKVHI
jgi:hypothetical protein